MQNACMAAVLTLKNVPDELYELLKRSAEAHRRSMNSEAIVCLESALRSQKLPVEQRLARLRELRASLPKRRIDHREFDALKREGRE
jgi:antitoxin FitA